MKIVSPEHIPETIQPKHGRLHDRAAGGFDALLDTNLKKMNVSEIQTGPAEMPRPLAAPVVPLDMIDRSELSDRVSGFLDSMETFVSRLGSGVSLKEIAPLVDAIEEETAYLKDVSEALPAGDEIKGIVDEVLIRASVETIKFNRGDYL